MLSPDNRLCPGVGGCKCGMFMSPAFKDPHPTCSRCRGRKCSSDSPCSDCRNWSLNQREMYNKRRSYAERNRPLVAILATPLAQAPFLHVLRLPSQQPPHQCAPPPSLPPSEGPVLGEETNSEDSKRTRVSSSLLLLVGEQGERGGTRTWSWLRVGALLPFPSLQRGKDGAIPSSATSHSN